jgi:3-hydroxyisobutyryl-CoA hydrolase
MATAAAEEPSVKFASEGAVRIATLNRPKKLNSLNGEMCDLLIPRLREYVKSDTAHIVILRGAGDKALCAGGDVAAIAESLRNQTNGEGVKYAADYFNKEFVLDHLIATYPKPYVAFMDGITMGGGFGLSMHAPFRIATEKTLFAMPETNIGYFPDVGGSFFLSRMDGEIGTYLGLTSERLKGYDNFFAGIATHYVPSRRLDELQARLSELKHPGNKQDFYNLINSTIEEFAEDAPSDYAFALGGAKRETIDRCFSHNSVEEIIAALEADGSEFSQKTMDTILKRSPSSVKVSLEAFRRAAQLDIKSVLAMDLDLATSFAKHPDFAEGVTALLVDKREPNWQPPTLKEVTDSLVQDYFVKTDQGDIKFFNEDTFTKYPYSYGLPSEQEIKDFVIGETSTRDYKASRKDVLEHFIEKKSGKIGLETKINEVLDRSTKPDPSDSTLVDWKY